MTKYFIPKHMKKIKLILLFMSVISFGVYAQTSTIRFDGLYQTAKEGNARHFLRFYADSTALSATSTGEATDVIKWLSRPYDDKGKYQIKNNNIIFSTTSTYGTVIYNGMIYNENTLILKTKSLINGSESERYFNFIKVEDTNSTN